MTWEHNLEDLPRPEPPPDLAAVVLARIARIDETAPAPAATPAPSAWPVWVTAFGALAAALALVASMQAGSVLLSRLAIPRVEGMWGLVLATSLVIYLIGLFGMISENR